MKRLYPQVRAGNEDIVSKAPKILPFSDEDETDLRSSGDDVAPEVISSSLIDTEAALKCVRNILLSQKDERRGKKMDCSKFPPVVFIHQLYNIIESKTVVNREIVGTKCSSEQCSSLRFANFSFTTFVGNIEKQKEDYRYSPW